MLGVRVQVGEVSGTQGTAEGFELEVQGFHVFAQVVLGAEVLAAGVTVKLVHCFSIPQKRFKTYELREVG